METKVSAGTIARTAVLLLALVNQVLVMLGIQVIPIEDETINVAVSTIWTSAASIIGWWKNNSFTNRAIQADQYMESLMGREGE